MFDIILIVSPMGIYPRETLWMCTKVYDGDMNQSSTHLGKY